MLMLEIFMHFIRFSLNVFWPQRSITGRTACISRSSYSC